MSRSLLVLLLLGAPAARADNLFTLALRTRPVGGMLGAEVLWPVGQDVALGGFAAYAYYWAELGVKAEWRYRGGLLIGGVWAGAEPGNFLPAAGGDERSAGLRLLARGRLELNLRQGGLWLYARSTTEARWRSFAERDPYRDALLDEELSFEQALAPLLRLAEWPGGGLWAYAELTAAAELSFGLLDLRPSAGLILEELAPGLTLDLDAYYSLREGPLSGFGVLLFVWWRPGSGG